MNARTRASALTLALVFPLAGCIDLAAPNLPSLGAGAVFTATIRQITGLPIDISASLNPGRDSAGVPRAIISPPLALGSALVVPPPTAQGLYIFGRQVPESPNFVGPFDIQPPVLQGLPNPPAFRWYGLKRLDPDTVVVDAAGDVTLRVQTEFGGTVSPANRSQQYFLELRGDANVIRVSGDGPPPAVLRIPSQFIPPAPSGRVFASLIYFQSATIVSQPPTYISSVTLDVRTQWFIRLR